LTFFDLQQVKFPMSNHLATSPKKTLLKGVATGLLFTIVWTTGWFFLILKNSKQGFELGEYLIGLIPLGVMCLIMGRHNGVRWGIGILLGSVGLLLACSVAFLVIASIGMPNMRY
jgi:hypothetical protein